MSSTRADRGRSGSLAGLLLCMVLHAGNSGAGPAGQPARLGNRPTPVNGCPQRIRNWDIPGWGYP
jgi:hypothetical protein